MKEKVQEERPEFTVDKQKLIHAGKVLKDSQTIEEIGLKETDFIVCMVSKDAASKVLLISVILLFLLSNFLLKTSQNLLQFKKLRLRLQQP